LSLAGLNKFNSPATAFQGAGRLIYFDEKGDTLTPAYIGSYDHNQLVSAFTQLQIIPNPSIISDRSKKLLSGDILHIGDRYLQTTDIVYVGMDINGLDDIDEAKSSYMVDFYLWFRYQGNFPADSIEFTNYSTENLGAGEKLTLNKPIEEGKEGGVNYKVYRMKAKFSENFDFRVYPFDSQTLKVKFRHVNLSRDKLIYVKDIVGMRGARSEKILERAQRTGIFDNISNWSVEKIEFFQNTLLNNSTLGKRKVIDSELDTGYSQFNVNIVIDRDVRSFVIKNLLPLLFFIIIAYLLTFLPLENVSIEAVSGLLLAVVFYHLNLTDKLPRTVGYTVLLDYAFYTVYFLLGLQLLTIVLSHSNAIKSYGISTSQLMQWNRIAFPSIIVLTSISLLWVVQQSAV
jgi:branched-chain amino acid transport system substrate-binding protein